MAFNYLNPMPRLGSPFQEVPANGKGLTFLNCSGATISKGQVAAIDMASTAPGFQNLICSTGQTAQKYPLVIALADCANQAQSSAFTPMGVVPAICTAGTVKGAVLMPGSANSTGGNILIAATTTSNSPPGCGIYADTGTALTSTPMLVLFNGMQRPSAVNSQIW